MLAPIPDLDRDVAAAGVGRCSNSPTLVTILRGDACRPHNVPNTASRNIADPAGTSVPCRDGFSEEACNSLAPTDDIRPHSADQGSNISAPVVRMRKSATFPMTTVIP